MHYLLMQRVFKHAIRLEYFDNAFVNSIAKIAKQKKIIDLTCVTF